jgi:hypothetical protein
MPSSLDNWQKRLEGHYRSLSEKRRDAGYPLFALEHGLNKGELDELFQLLRSSLASGFQLENSWLGWIVYVTEYGYSYEGSVYWKTLEEQTKGWKASVSRIELRYWFGKFQKQFSGVKPSGQWAEWFKNIAWPITHSILPKYFQFQLAKSLYDLRYQLAQLTSLSSSQVGKLIAQSNTENSARFGEFLQQEELVGRIVLGLISNQDNGGFNRIYEPTLKRITNDLEAVRSAKVWLSETRSVFADRIKFSSPNLLSFPSRTTEESWKEKSVTKRSLRPELMLRPEHDGSWTLIVEFGGFKELATTSPEYRVALRTSRCRITSETGTWFPPGWAIFAKPIRVLKSWPLNGEPLLQFESQNKDFSDFVQKNCLISQGPVWLFRIGADMFAREIIGQNVCTGREYILLLPEEPKLPISFGSKCNLTFQGINAYHLSIPDKIEEAVAAVIHDLGLSYSQSIQVWVAGIPNIGWNHKGHIKILSTEPVHIGIVSDSPVTKISIRIDDDSEKEIVGKAPGIPTFIKLPTLDVGEHAIKITAVTGVTGIGLKSKTIEELIELEVASPATWIPGSSTHGGLSAFIDPFDSKLDDFWQGNSKISLLGPDQANVDCLISLFRLNKSTIMADVIGQFRLPFSNEIWQKKLTQFVEAESNIRHYLEAASGKVVFHSEEFGNVFIPLEREVKPLRLVSRNEGRAIQIGLIDDTGLESAATLEYFSFESPDHGIAINIDETEWSSVKSTGGLYFARNGIHEDKAIGCSRQVQGLAGFNVSPNLTQLVKNGSHSEICKLLEIWHGARAIGPLENYRLEKVIEEFCGILFEKICGKNWMTSEKAFLNQTASRTQLEYLTRQFDRPGSFSLVLQRDFPSLQETPDKILEWFSDLSRRYQVCTEPIICEFGLRLATEPHGLLKIYNGNLPKYFEEIQKWPSVIRAARFLSLLSPSIGMSSLPRWKWKS